MPMKRAVSLFFLLLPTLISAQNFELSTLNLTTLDGLAGNNVYCSMQDNQGYMWFGTDTGVSRYNGRTFENFYTHDGLADNEILRIDKDSKGRIWFSALNGGLSFYHNGAFYNADNHPLLAKNPLIHYYTTFFEDSKGRIWLISRNGKVVCLDLNSNEMSFNHEFTGMNFGMIREVNNEVQIFNQRIGQLSVEMESLVVKKTQEFTFKGMAKWVSESNFGASGVLMNEGFMRYYFEHYTGIQLTSEVTKIVGGPDEMWFCTNDGVYRVLAEDNGHSNDEFLQGMIISHVFKDKEGGHWFTSLGKGVFYAPLLKSQSISKSGSKDLNIISRLYSNNGEFWFGGDGLKFGKIESQGLILGSGSNENGRLMIKDIVEGSSDGRMLFAAEDLLIETDGLEILNMVPFSAKAIHGWDNDRMVVGTSYGLYVLSQQQFNTVLTLKPNESTFRRDIKVEFKLEGRLWITDIDEFEDGLIIGTLNGLKFLSPDLELSNFAENEMSSKRINRVLSFPDKSGFIIATHGSGIYIYRSGHWRNIRKEEGLTSDICTSLAFGNAGEIWVGTNKGINQVQLDSVLEIKPVLKSHGLASEEVYDVVLIGEELYAGTSNGLSRINTIEWAAFDSKPTIHIKDILSSREKLDTAVHHLSYGQRSIQFSYEGIDLSSEDRMFYEYRLIGMDSTWTTTTSEQLSYGALAAGNFRLELRSVSALGQSSDLLVWQFSIARPLWQKWWFWTAMTLIVLFVIIYIIRLVIRQNQIKTERELSVKLRIAEAERKALQSQLNPHFIFNALNSIQNMVFNHQPDQAFDYLDKFSKLIRRVLEFSSKSLVSLKDELETLCLYMDLENMRLKDRFDYEIEIDEGINMENLIPSLLMQPHVENAIWHGIMPLPSTVRGKIKLEIISSLEGFGFLITDNGVGRKKSLGAKGMGIELSKNLLNSFGPGQVEIQDLYKDATPVGTKVIIKVDHYEKHKDQVAHY